MNYLLVRVAPSSKGLLYSSMLPLFQRPMPHQR